MTTTNSKSSNNRPETTTSGAMGIKPRCYRGQSGVQLRKQARRFQRHQQHRDNGIVTIAALKAALSQSAVSYLDTGDALDHQLMQQQPKQQSTGSSKTMTAVFVSEYL